MFINDAVFALENSKFLIAVFLDVKMAFDNMVHRHILEGVLEAKIKGRLLGFSHDFLMKREVNVKIGKATSVRRILRRRGVPQGSTLGIDYYNISEFDIPLDIGGERAGIFADDNGFWVITNCIEEGQKTIQETLNSLEIWAGENCVKFSTQKTKAMLITRKRNFSLPNLMLNRVQIEFVNEFKWLGLTFDKNLTFKPHIKTLKTACERRINIMKMLSGANFGPKPQFMVEFYLKYIRPKMEYGSLIYCAGSKSLLEELETIQYSAIRIAFSARKTTPRSFLLSESGLVNLAARREILALKFLRKTWTADKSNPIKSRLLKEGRLWCSSRKMHGLVRAKEIMERYTNECSLTEMLRVLNLEIVPQWKARTFPCETEFELWDGLDVAKSFRMSKDLKYGQAVDIFTDASKKDQKVGAAFVIPSRNVRNMMQFDSSTTVYQAEVLAIAEAVRST